MTRVQNLEKQIKEKQEELKSLNIELAEAISLTFFKCSSCGKKTQAKKCVLIDYQSWDPNTGSPCGGFYTNSGYYWCCPSCGHYRSHTIKDDIFYRLSAHKKCKVEKAHSDY